MRKSKEVKIGKKVYTINELTVKDIIELVDKSSLFGSTSSEGGVEGKSSESELNIFKSDIAEVLGRCCDFTIEEIQEENLAPSEIRLLWETWREVNSDFLAVLKGLGIVDLIMEYKSTVLNNFLRTLAI